MSMVISSSEFKEEVRANLIGMKLQDIFMIPEYHIEALYDKWCRRRAQEEYKVYLQMTTSVPDGYKLKDESKWIFSRTRRLVDEFIVSLTESYYYDGMFFSPDHINPQPFISPRIERLDKAAIEYFLDTIDFSYGRIYAGSTTIDLLRQAVKDRNYLK